MILLEKPYVSDFLLESIQSYGFQVIATETAQRLCSGYKINWITEEDAISQLNSDPHYPIYTNSENALEWFNKHIHLSNHSYPIKVFKDKLLFREILSDLYPSFQFIKKGIGEIQHLKSDDFSFPFVLKPSVGFFSLGVYIIQSEKDLIEAKKVLDPKSLPSIFPKSVLDNEAFIIEEFIEGEEYAIDYYYDANGDVIILNILHHWFSTGSDTSDRVYVTSKEIITSLEDSIQSFLTHLGTKLQLRNFPAHAEIRIDTDGNIHPIEINPLRYGGFCTTGDILGLAIGLNEYDYFFSNKKPNWDELFSGKEDKLLSIVVLNNNSGYEANEIAQFDYDKLASDFEHPIEIRKMDINEYPLFGFVFTETTIKNKSELERILKSDLREYLVLK